jgi:nucleotide-binding universal stress UspA family protein
MAHSPVQRILVTVDFSPCSGEALRFAFLLAAALDSSIEVLYVLETSTRLLDSSAGQPPPADPAAAQERLHQFVMSIEGPKSVPMTERVEAGDVHERIVSIAEHEDFDLIVMGTNGRMGRPLGLVGSVAAGVVRMSPRPVLTIREAPSERKFPHLPPAAST